MPNRLFARQFLLAACIFAVPVYATAIDFGVAAEGRLVPGNGLIALAAPQGGVVQTLSVKAGDIVKQGTVLATTYGIDAARADAQAAKEQAMAADAAIVVASAQAEAGYAALTVAENALQGVKSGVTEAKAGVSAAQKDKIRALAQHDAAVANLLAEVAEYQRVIDELDPPRKDREELTIKQNLLNSQITNLAGQRDALEATLDAAVAQAQAAVSVAQAHVSSSRAQRAQAEAEANAAKVALEQARAAASAAHETAEAAETAISLYEVRAPIDGEVIGINTYAGEAVGPTGILYLGDTSKMYVEAEVYIDDLRRVKSGQKVTITAAAIDKELSGEVVSVGRMVSPANVYSPDPTLFTDRRVVNVRIAVDDSEAVKNLTYAQVTVRIKTASE